MKCRIVRDLSCVSTIAQTILQGMHLFTKELTTLKTKIFSYCNLIYTLH